MLVFAEGIAFQRKMTQDKLIMRYHPFLSVEHPKLFRQIEASNFDLSVMRKFKNPRYFDNKLCFSSVIAGEIMEYEFPLDEEKIDLSKETRSIIDGVAYLCKSLADADEIDMRVVNTPMSTQYAVMNSFRAIHPGYGGQRYVAICRDIIDNNMGSSLHPYMYCDLVTAMFLNFNKSTGKDVDGLLSGVYEFLEDINLDEEELRGIYSAIGGKCSPIAYRKFAITVLKSPKLGPSMRHMIVASMSLVRFDSKEIAPELPMPFIAKFPKEDLALILKNAPSGLKTSLKMLFQCIGEEIDESLVNAYMENPYRDLSLLSEAPFFPSLSSNLKRKILRGRIFTSNSSTSEIIQYFGAAEDDRERGEIIHACQDMGRRELACALCGQDFSLLPFQIHEVRALLPYANFKTPNMMLRLNSYLSHYFDRRERSEDLDAVLLGIDERVFAPLIGDAVIRGAFYSKAKRLAMADRLKLIDKLGWKEWNYHD